MEVMVKRKRAAAYCRVSTDLEMQEGSFEWQKRHYMELLSGNPDVELVHVYGDEGCSGRYADRRPEFQQMLQDCEDGKIDVIYTKSISRFSRNLADCVTVIRRLKELGIPIIFEKEGINSMDSQSELLFHILTIIAQEESNSISQNVKWGIDKRHAEGKPTGKVPYGYRKADRSRRTSYGVCGLKSGQREAQPDLLCHTPHGVRGLKWEKVKKANRRAEMAPRMGCID